MIRIGLIGSIGSGKSFIAKLFKYPVFNADNEVKFIYKNNRNCFDKLRKNLPNFIKSFPIVKNELIAAINHDKKNLKKISKIVHPLVRRRLEAFVKRNKKNKIVVLDIPLLIENKLYKKDDILIYVKSDRKIISERLKKRKNFNIKMLKNLKDNQLTLLKKRKLANYIIDNNLSRNIVKQKIKNIKKQIINERNYSRH